MSESILSGKSERLMSLDVFRGITIAGMVLVNNPGSWGHVWGPLGHATWHGWTPTDFIFPFFLFIVGVAMVFSFDKRLAQGQSQIRLFEQIVRRTIILFLLGLILTCFPNFAMVTPLVMIIAGLGLLYSHEPVFGFGNTDRERVYKIAGYALLAIALGWIVLTWNVFISQTRGNGQQWAHLWVTQPDDSYSHIRVPGVLQRIALAYFFASLIMMAAKSWRSRIAWTAALLFGYWVIVRFIPAPEGYVIAGRWEAKDFAVAGTSLAGELHDYIDVKILGPLLYSGRPDPEGILSTLGAIATVMMGVLTGMYLLGQGRSRPQKAAGLFVAANFLVVAGLVWGYEMPINKKIWTSSYVVLMAGFAIHFLAFCYYLIDELGYKKWAKPFLVFGTNAIFVFFASGILARLMNMIPVGDMRLKPWLYEKGFLTWLGRTEIVDGVEKLQSTYLSSHAFAVAYILLWLLLTYPLYRKRIVLKI